MESTNSQHIISIIVAVSDNLAIGRAGDMPWHLKADLKYFKTTTSGNSVIMGRKTWESLGCRPLPNRQNIVVSRTLTESNTQNAQSVNAVPAATFVSSLEAALEAATSHEVFIMGGGEIYRQAMPFAERLYITHIHTVVEDADTFFPAIDHTMWQRIDNNNIEQDEASQLSFEFALYQKKLK